MKTFKQIKESQLEDLQEGKNEIDQLRKMLKMTKDLMKEVEVLFDRGNTPDLQDQIIRMDKNMMDMRDVIRKAGKITGHRI